MAVIKLNHHEWPMGAEIAPGVGGFGKIYESETPDGERAVLKLIPIAPGAERELLFENLAGVPNVIPILDSGEFENNYVIAMPRADRSLREHLTQGGGRLPVSEVIKILTDVATALSGLEKDVVHRDIKPENLLLYQNCWCLADFGIARYAEKTTALDTKKFSFTPPYAAPEQWRLDRATSATDAYAMGVVAYEMLGGQLPFPGPEVPDFREQHLNREPAPLEDCPPALASMVSELLLKAPEARPPAQNLLARLEGMDQPVSNAVSKLLEANQAITQDKLAASTAESARRSEAERRSELLQAARPAFEEISRSLRSQIASAATHAEFSEYEVDVLASSWLVRFGRAVLTLTRIQATDMIGPLRHGNFEFFDVLAVSFIKVEMSTERQPTYTGRSHSLWFCNAQENGVYRWYETAFMLIAPTGGSPAEVPFNLPPEGAALPALASATEKSVQIAWPFTPIDQGEEQKFIDRWIEWFADASQGNLSRPKVLPEHPVDDTWRCSPIVA